METLADAYLRAVRAVRAAPLGAAARFVLQTETAAVLARELLGNDAPQAPTVGEPGFIVGAELTDAERALVRAHRADDAVRVRWLGEVLEKREPEPNIRDAPPGEKWLSVLPAVACWAAEVIVRRRVEVRALEAEPSAEQLADWLEVFSKALGLALSRAEMVHLPVFIGGMLDFFAEGATDRATRSPNTVTPVLERQRSKMAMERTFRTFAAGDLQHWRLTPPVGHQFALDLPFEKGADPRHGRGVRSVLTGQVMRAYTATFALTGVWAAEHGGMNPHGLFEMDPRKVLLELYGLSPTHTTVRGKRYERPPTTAEKELREAFGTLHLCLLEGIGNISAAAPEPLLQRYRDDRTGRTVYRQASLAMLTLRKHFIQVPLEVVRLEAIDTPLALGVARGLLQHARTILRGAGHWRCTLEELARTAGDPIDAHRRNRGATEYYRTLAERLHRVVHDGKLGKVHIEREGPGAMVTLTPSDALGTVYGSLAETLPAEPLEAAVAKALTGKRRTGRPRKGPLA
jgi:hypothetical protein